MKINYRFLVPAEYSLTENVMHEHGGDVPDSNLSVIAGAFDESENLRGFAVLQYIPHLEPVYIDPEYRGKVSWRRFQQMIEGLFEGEGSYYILPENDRVAKLCERGGMQKLELSIYRRDLDGKS